MNKANEEKKPEKKPAKIVRGWNLSMENVLWLTRVAMKRTLTNKSGRTVSGSEVLDEIVTAAREKIGDVDVMESLR
jgi:phosphoribosylformylglycinamidine (FGAM) synthase-like enzyme